MADISHSNNKKLMKGQKYFIYRKGIAGWRIIPQTQGKVITFELYQDWTVKTWQHQPRYGNNTPFLV